jgi:predicted DNA-binding protein
MPENALAVVAANLSSKCSAKEKSKRVREIIETTLEEIEY